MSGGAISWKTKLQDTVALSSCDAEYQALSSATQEALFLSNLVSDMNIDTNEPTIIHVDNTAAMFMATNPTVYPKNKHIDIRHHFIRDLLTWRCWPLDITSPCMTCASTILGL